MRREQVILVISLVASVISGLAGCARSGPAAPVIEFTRLPPSGEGSPTRLLPIEGRVRGAKHGQQIVLFARAGVWWVQPLDSDALTPLQRDFTWKNSTHPGTAYAAILVDPGYRPPPTAPTLPPIGGPVHAVATADGAALQQPSPRTLHFSGYEWRIRQTASNPGGSTNTYDPSNAWTDQQGFLHLRISGAPNDWKSAEVNVTHSLGYGSYQFTVRDVSHLELPATLSISTWDDSGPSREMDIEIGRWGESLGKNAQFVVQPYYVPANTVRFATPPCTVKYSFRWDPGRVTFEAQAPGKEPVARHVFSSGVPSPGEETIHLNHYVFRNRRSPLQKPSEVVIEKFEFLP